MGRWIEWRGFVRVNEHDPHKGIWCPACCTTHVYDERWTFDGNWQRPTFTPSMNSKIGHYVDGSPRGPDGKCWICENAKERGRQSLCCICHFNVTAGQIIFHGDCTHGWGGRTVPLTLPPPARMEDE